MDSHFLVISTKEGTLKAVESAVKRLLWWVVPRMTWLSTIARFIITPHYRGWDLIAPRKAAHQKKPSHKGDSVR